MPCGEAGHHDITFSTPRPSPSNLKGLLTQLRQGRMMLFCLHVRQRTGPRFCWTNAAKSWRMARPLFKRIGNELPKTVRLPCFSTVGKTDDNSVMTRMVNNIGQRKYSKPIRSSAGCPKRKAVERDYDCGGLRFHQQETQVSQPEN